MSASIKVYGAPCRPDCKRAKKFLGEQRSPYDWIYIEQDGAGGHLAPCVA